MPSDKPYVIVGPDDDDEMPTYWDSVGWGGWGNYDKATHFNAAILTTPLPPETRYILDANTLQEYHQSAHSGQSEI